MTKARKPSRVEIVRHLPNLLDVEGVTVTGYQLERWNGIEVMEDVDKSGGGSGRALAFENDTS